MTTAFTAPIKQGSPLFRFRDFALRCAHGIDFAGGQHEEGLDVPLREEPLDPAYIERVTMAAEDLYAALNRSAADWIDGWNRHTRLAREERQKAEEDAGRLRRRYEAMLADVEAWTPPTHMHVGLKNLMREQLTASIEVDCPEQLHPPVEVATADEYKAHEIQRLTVELQQRQGELEDQQERVSLQNDWIRDLWASLAAHPYPTALAAEQEAAS